MYPNDPYQQNQPPGGQPWGAPPAYRTTNGMAIAALVGALVFAPLGIILGHIARSQIKRTGEGGRGMATAGLVIGYVFTAFAIVGVLVAVVLVAVVVNTHTPTYTPPTIYDPSSAFPVPGSTPP
jgi:hypothetical protein